MRAVGYESLPVCAIAAEARTASSEGVVRSIRLQGQVELQALALDEEVGAGERGAAAQVGVLGREGWGG